MGTVETAGGLMCGEIGEGERMCGEEGGLGCVAVWDVSGGCAEGDVVEDCVKGEEGCVTLGCVKGNVPEGKGLDCVGIKGI